jgi:cytidine deaminase
MISPADRALVAAAQAAIRERYRPHWHVVGAALRTVSGRIFTGVHLEATIGRIAVCAEAIALGRAVTEAGEPHIHTIVAVYHPDEGIDEDNPRIVAPCGMCREMIADYSPGARVLVPDGGDRACAVSIQDLLPHRFSRP